MRPTPRDLVAELRAAAGLGPDALAELSLTGEEPVLPSSFRVDAAAQAAIGAAGLAAADIFRQRTGIAQSVRIDIRHAAAEFRSESYLRFAGEEPGELWDAIAGTYLCGDDRWVRLHTNFPHHRAGVLDLLGCAPDRASVAAALRQRDAITFETAATDAGLCVAAMRSFAEWDAHPHAAHVQPTPLQVIRLADAPALPFTNNPARPLDGVRVLDLTRVIAGPVASRTLAAHGADVLHITGPDVPNLPRLIRDTGRGKRAAILDLDSAAGQQRLRELIATADVFVQSYRHGALAARGFGAADLAALRPGLVIATLSAYGETGPWGGKRGFDSLVQTATGFNHAEAQAAGADRPKPLPCQALDHASGHLLAFGIMAALRRRADEGGTFHVRTALAATAHWLRSLGRLPDGLNRPDTTLADIPDLLETTGPITAVRHAAQLSHTPAGWDRPADELGASAAGW